MNLIRKVFPDFTANLFQFCESILVTVHSLVIPFGTVQFPESIQPLGRLKTHGHFVKIVLQTVPLTPFNLFHYVPGQPPQKILVGFRQGVKHPFNALLDKRNLVKLNLIGGELSDFPGEGPECLLVKFV